MIAQTYKYSAARSELKPVEKTSKIHSLRIGEQNPNLLFINKVGEKNTNPASVTYRRTNEGTRFEFSYAGARYAFILPLQTKRGQIIAVKLAR